MKKLLFTLLIVFAFSCIGFAADVELDYMEYSDDPTVQVNYPTNGHYAITFVNTAQLDTAQKVFGLSSLLLDGDSDCVTALDSTDWVFGTNDFTLDFRVRFNALGSEHRFLAQGPDNANRWDFYWYDGNALVFLAYTGNVNQVSLNTGADSWTPVVDTWYHVALVRSGNTFTVYIDGTEIYNKEDDSSIGDYAGTLKLGMSNIAISYLNGWMDEVRISNYARWTSTPFVVPTVPYQTDANTKLLLHFDGANEAQATVDSSRFEGYSENIVKEQGSYSLKAVAVQDDSLNDTLTRTVSPTIDLTGYDTIKYYIYSADRTGSQIKIGIHDSGGTTTEHTANISSTSAWELQTWDISAVSDANKDVIDSIIITILNADAANTFYLDWMYGTGKIEAEHPTTSQLLLGGLWFKDVKLQHSDWTRFKRGTSE